MPEQRPDTIIIIAPKGAKYSSVSDEFFEECNDSTKGIILELTLEEYGAWAITADSLDATADGSISLNMQRIKQNEDGSYTDVVLDFPGMAPGHFEATLPLTSWFRGKPNDIFSNNFYEFLVRVYLDLEVRDYIRAFYHRDKFYLHWSVDTSGYLNPRLTATSVMADFPQLEFKLNV